VAALKKQIRRSCLTGRASKSVPAVAPGLGRFSCSSYSVIVGAFKRSLALRDIL
jgi:hypothetical protein